MTNTWSFCFIIAFHDIATLEKNRLTYQCPSSWPVVITMKEEISQHLKNIYIGYWPVQMNGNKFATDQILRNPVEVVKERILAGWAPKSPESWAGAQPGTRTPTGPREVAPHQNDAKPKFATILCQTPLHRGIVHDGKRNQAIHTDHCNKPTYLVRNEMPLAQGW